MISKTKAILMGLMVIFLVFLTGVNQLPGAESKSAIPGVMRTIRPFVNYTDTYQWSAMPEVVGQSSYDWARDLFYNREIWCLEFSFKPVRMVNVDFPTDKGTLNRVNVWYMVYSVTNTGKCIKNKVDDQFKTDNKYSVMVKSAPGKLEPKTYEKISHNLEGTYRPEVVDYNGLKAGADGKVPGSIQFTPQFVLTSDAIYAPFTYEQPSKDRFMTNRATVPEEAVYYDEFLPLAFVKIATLEDAQQKMKFESTITMPSRAIKPGETVWGIATWVDRERQADTTTFKSIDPRIDKFSVYISGLTNALRWEDSQAAYESNAKILDGRKIFRKVLKLNFFRPGDEFDEKENEVHFGRPGELDYQWIYM